MKDPKRTEVIYVSADSSLYAKLSIPYGMISPPMIDIHQPEVGTFTFYHAICYNLPIPKDAKK